MSGPPLWSGWNGPPARCGGQPARRSHCAEHAPNNSIVCCAEARRQVAAENGQVGRSTLNLTLALVRSLCRRFATAVCGPQQFESVPSRPRATRRLQIAGTAFVVVWLACVLAAFGQTPPPKKGGKGKGGPGNGEVKMPTPAFRTEVPACSHDVLLGRPTRNTVSASVLAFRELEVFIEHGTVAGTYPSKTATVKLPSGEPRALELTGLAANTRHFYRLRHRSGGAGEFAADPERSFHTARAAGSAFTFTVQADPHLDFGTEPEVYKQSLTNALAAQPDFHVDLGDTFMTDKYTDFKLAAPQYLAQRYYFGLVGHSAPVLLVLGNHDGETLGRGGDTTMAAWSNAMRKKYFPNPEPNAFFTGNATPHPQAGRLQDYYAFEWGDALFIALDQFWFSAKPRGGGKDGDNWWRTLGTEQYTWLRRMLETSRAKFTFVFTHHLVGGATPEGRGGAEASRFFEWGGHELDGRNTFAQKRPGWPAPIHDLLAKRGGCIVFHGHDHLYVRAERDGVIYQEVPQPGHARGTTRSAEEYSYRSGIILPSSGILRVRVTPAEAAVDYVKADAAGTVLHRYAVGGAR